MEVKLIFLTGLFTLGGCYSSSKPAGDGSTADTAGEPDAIIDTIDAIVPDVIPDTEQEPDATPNQCVTDGDCVVALHEDRCCITCPEVMSRSELSEDPCFHELGTSFEFPVPSPECMHDCYACVPCSDDPVYMARCVGGACVPVRDACDFPEVSIPIPDINGSDFSDPERYAPYAGLLVNVSGRFYPGPDSCACCFECFCDCYDVPVQVTIDCAIILRGTICDERFQCLGTECDGFCTPGVTGGTGGATGFLVPNEFDPPELWVINWGVYY